MDYIMNPDKTDDKLLISSFACSPETADIEFALTRKSRKENVMDKGDNLAFHLIQSFMPGEVDAATAHALGKQFADEVLKGKYEYIISTHIDKGHVHNHIILMQPVFVTITSMFLTNAVTTKSAGSGTVYVRKTDWLRVCQKKELVEVTKRTWSTIMEIAGKQN